MSRTIITYLLFTAIFAIGFLLNIAFFQAISWVIVAATLFLNFFSAATLLYKTEKLIKVMSEKYSRKQISLMLLTSAPFIAANIYIFNGYQIQYVYMFSALISFISGIIVCSSMKSTDNSGD